VLLVDESEASRTQVTEALREAGFLTLAMGNAEAALAMWTLFRPQVVLMAAHAPGFGSLAVARRLQRLSKEAVPFIYLLDAPDPELRLQVLEKGHGVDALGKPLELREVVARVRGLLRFREGVRRTARPADDEIAALRDQLTDTWTRRAMTAFVRQELLRCERHGGGFGVLGIELQGVRHLRRTFGRGMANRLVLYASAVLLQACREADVVGRVADDRFAVLLPSTPQEGLSLLRARLADRFEQARFQVDGRVVRVAASIGYTSFPDLHGNPRRLLSAAFAALPQPELVQMPVLS
jgi:diguanylate cyclase (GGDEF)-like protein